MGARGRTSTSSFILSVCSGVLLALSFPKPDLGWLAWFALVPLLIGLLASPFVPLPPGDGTSRARRAGRGPRTRAFRLGYSCGLTFFLLLLYWIYPTCRAGGVAAPVALLATAALAAVLALQVGLFALGVALLSPSPLWGEGRGRGVGRPTTFLCPLASAALWVALEMLREHVLAFPWALLGYSQWRYPVLTQIASVTGVHGLSFLIVWLNASIASVLPLPLGESQDFPLPLGESQDFPLPLGESQDFPLPLGEGRVRGMDLRPLAPPLAALAITLLYGAWALRAPETAPTLSVAVLQGNIDQYKKWDSAFVAEIQAAYSGLAESLPLSTGDAKKPPLPRGEGGVRETEHSKPDLIVWPETALPGRLEEPGVAGWVADLVRRTATYHVIGAIARAASGQASNDAALLGPDGAVRARYAKRHLVPFGEYVPLQGLLGKWVPILTTLGGVAAGSDPRPLPFPGAPLGASVCYEVVFPEEVRRTVQAGAGALVNVTNDGWYLDTAAPFQHLAMSALRAVENRRPLVRAANTGVSAVFDARGRLAASLPLGRRGVLRSGIAPRHEATPFTRFGELFAWLCVLVTVAALMVPLSPRERAG